jgi:CheY-like chemotaxis protein
VHSAGPGQGSEFAISIPVLAQSSAPKQTQPAASRASAHRRSRVLVVDDNRDSADTLAALLEAWGHEVRTLYDGPSAIAATAEFQPNVVLLDIGLPKMNGYEVAAQLRKSASRRPLILVAFTGYGQDEDRRRVREAGFDYHLVKPLEPAELQKILDSVIADAAAA